METETWFIMEDGSNGDPREIAADAKGVLRHKDGRAVDYAPHGPRSRSVDAHKERAKAKDADEERERAKEKPKAKPDEDGTKARDMKADEPKQAYKTRDAKAD